MRTSAARLGVPPDASVFLLLLSYVALLSGKARLPSAFGPLAATELRWFLAYIALVMWIYWRHVAPRTPWGFPLTRYWVAVTVFHAYLAVTSLWAPPSAPVASLLADISLLVILVGIAIDVFRQSPQAVDMLFWALAMTSLVYAAGSILEGPGPQGRYSAFGGGPNVFVRVESVGVIASIFLAARKRSVRWWGVAVISAVGVALSGSRGGVVALAACALLLAPHAIAALYRMRVLGRGLLAISLTVAAAWLTLGDLVISVVVPRFIELTLVNPYSSGRDGLYAAAMELFEQRPLAGWGVGGFYAEKGQMGGFVYAHNILLNVGAEAGLLGVAMFLIAFGSGLLGIRRLSTPLSASYTLTVLGIYFFVASLFSGGYYDLRFGWLFLGLGLVSKFEWKASVRADNPSEQTSPALVSMAG